MASNLQDRVLDYGLDVLSSEATHLHICNAEPTDHTEASATFSLGNKNWGAGNVTGAPEAATPNGRKVVTLPITDGTIGTTDDATHWAITDDTNNRLLAVGSLAALVGVTSGQGFSLGAFDIRKPSE